MFNPLGDNIKKMQEQLKDLDHLPTVDPDAHSKSCPKCDGYGHIIDEHGARPCQCVQRELHRKEISDARIPHRYQDKSLENFNPHRPSLKNCLQRAEEYVKDYSLESTRGLYIYGPTGVGKTHLAIGILNALISRGYDGVFYNVIDLLDNIRATFDPNAKHDTKTRLLKDLERQIFVLDDFGMQKASSWVSDRLYSLINRRYQDYKTIIITSNISLNNLLLRVDKALSSRIIDMCEEIEMVADDYRLRTIKSSSNR